MSRTCWKRKTLIQTSPARGIGRSGEAAAGEGACRSTSISLPGTPPEQVIAGIAEKLLAGDGRLIVIADDEVFLSRLDRMLWDQGAGELPSARACRRRRRRAAADTAVDQPGRAQSRAQHADRRRGVARFGLVLRPQPFSCSTMRRSRRRARRGRRLPGREGVERRYWAREAGKWVKKALRLAAAPDRR